MDLFGHRPRGSADHNPQKKFRNSSLCPSCGLCHPAASSPLAKESFRELHNSARLAANDLRAVLHHLQGREQLELALAVAGAGGYFVIQAVHKFQLMLQIHLIPPIILFFYPFPFLFRFYLSLPLQTRLSPCKSSNATFSTNTSKALTIR